jgi:hypothetical protein
MKNLNTWLTIAITAAAIAQAVFACFLWLLQRELSQDRRRAFVAVVLHANPNLSPRVAVRFENASSSGVLFRYLTLAASAKGRKAHVKKILPMRSTKQPDPWMPLTRRGVAHKCLPSPLSWSLITPRLCKTRGKDRV